jgi:hypothetical protein
MLLLASVTWCGIEFHVVMALCSTVRLPKSVLDLGTVPPHVLVGDCLLYYSVFRWVFVNKLRRWKLLFLSCVWLLCRQFTTLTESLTQTMESAGAGTPGKGVEERVQEHAAMLHHLDTAMDRVVRTMDSWERQGVLPAPPPAKPGVFPECPSSTWSQWD